MSNDSEKINVEDEKKRQEEKLGELIDQLAENSDTLSSFMSMLARLKEAGIINMLDNITRDYMPTDVEFFAHMFSSREFTFAGLKSANVMLSVMHAMADEGVSDMIKLFMFNLGGIVDQASEAGNDHSKMKMMELLHTLKDPETASGMRALLSMVKSIGNLMEKSK
ncbi:MAG: helical membrane plugin domain-containing protein [Thermoplasmataceae archaeon]